MCTKRALIKDGKSSPFTSFLCCCYYLDSLIISGMIWLAEVLSGRHYALYPHMFHGSCPLCVIIAEVWCSSSHRGDLIWQRMNHQATIKDSVLYASVFCLYDVSSVKFMFFCHSEHIYHMPLSKAKLINSKHGCGCDSQERTQSLLSSSDLTRVPRSFLTSNVCVGQIVVITRLWANTTCLVLLDQVQATSDPLRSIRPTLLAKDALLWPSQMLRWSMESRDHLAKNISIIHFNELSRMNHH